MSENTGVLHEVLVDAATPAGGYIIEPETLNDVRTSVIEIINDDPVSTIAIGISDEVKGVTFTEGGSKGKDVFKYT